MARITKEVEPTFDEFKEQQGCPYLIANKVAFFENGASWNTQTLEYSDPPEEEIDLLRALLAYDHEHLKQTEDEFRDLKAYIGFQTQASKLGAGPPAERMDFDNLKTLQQKVLQIRDQIQQRQARIRKLTGPTAWDKFNERRARDRDRADLAFRELAQIQI